MNQLNVINFII